MIQSYTPDLEVPAVRGYCLMYIDDAGDAPARTATARYSWQVERDAGRLHTDELPDDVWVVGWLDFTQGLYSTYGHVFFIKRSGKEVTIYDSEVAAGARSPYKSINELLAWFGAYSPVYLGWSTDCDGRNYAKEGDEVNITRDQVIWHYRLIGGIEPSEQEIKNYTGKEYAYATEDMKSFFANAGRGYNLYRTNTDKTIAELKSKIVTTSSVSESDKKMAALTTALKDVLGIK